MQTILNRNRIFYIATGGTGVNNTATPKIDTGNVGVGSDLYRNGDRGATPNSTPTQGKSSDWLKWLIGAGIGGLLTGLITWLINEVPKWFKSKEAEKKEAPKKEAADATRPEAKPKDNKKTLTEMKNVEKEKPKIVDKVNKATVKLYVGKEPDKTIEAPKKMTLISTFGHDKRTYSKDEEYKLKMAQIFNAYVKEKGIAREVFASADKSGKVTYNKKLSEDRAKLILDEKDLSKLTDTKVNINGESLSTNNYDAISRSVIQTADFTKTQYEELNNRWLEAGITQEQINSSFMDASILKDNKVLEAMVYKTTTEASNDNIDKTVSSVSPEEIANYVPDFKDSIKVVETGKDMYKEVEVTYLDSKVQGMNEIEKNNYVLNLAKEQDRAKDLLANNKIDISNGITEVITKYTETPKEAITIGGNSNNSITIGNVNTINKESNDIIIGNKGNDLSF